jgi:hypothetical protein
MSTVQRRHSKEEIAERGDAIYERFVKPRLAPADDGKFVAIDIESNDFELAQSELSAVDRLRARVPDAQIWLVRVGSPYLHRFGGREQRST